MKCELNVKSVNRDGRKYDNLIIKTPKGTQVEVRLAFPNHKLVYKLVKEVEESEK